MSWFDLLLPASFNGVPFYVDRTEKSGGRRRVVHEFPQRDDPYIEPLGRLPRNFSIKAYVAEDFFAAQRLLLETALENAATAGTLIHPTYGILNVWVGAYRSAESRDGGSYATIDFDCTLAGGAASPIAITNTVSALLSSLDSLMPYLAAAYVATTVFSAISNVLAVFVGAQLTNAAGAFNALPQSTVGGIGANVSATASTNAAAIVAAFAGAAASPAATAAAITTCFRGAAANVVAAQTPNSAATTPVSGVLPSQPMPADPSGGLLGLCIWGASLPAPAAAQPALAAAQTAIVTLVQGAAVMSVLSVYAQIDFISSNQAFAAQAALQPALDAQVAAAANAGNYDLFRAWRAISAQFVTDIQQRAQSLPTLASYSFNGPLPAFVLAQKLYQDATQADNLVALNAAPHPLFMPPSGVWLRAA